MATASNFFKKHPRGKPLTSSAKQVILNVYSSLRQQESNLSDRDVVAKTAKLTGVSDGSIYAARKEVTQNGRLSTPGKKRPAAVNTRTRMKRYDDFTLSCVRRKIHAMYQKNEIPTSKKVTAAINADEDLPEMSSATVKRLMKDIGFVYAKRKRDSALIERDDILIWRRRYLRTIKQYRREGRPIYYTDETWVNAGHTTSKVYQDTTVTSARDAFVSGLTTGLKAPSGKGGRLIITHAGNESGFVPNACEVFRASKGKGDYHKEMNGPYYEKWFTEKLLPNLEPNSVIVVDNAPYHTVRLESIPTQATRKGDIQNWLTAKSVPWTADMLKPELLNEVARVKHLYEAYRIDTLAAQEGHVILRLPPYHCELNPIEMIWSQVKGYVAGNNTAFTLEEVGKLASTGIAEVTVKNWEDCVRHVQAEEQKFWEIDCLTENVVERLAFTVNGSSDSDSDLDGSISGIEEME